jgi:hypothetical protein
LDWNSVLKSSTRFYIPAVGWKRLKGSNPMRLAFIVTALAVSTITLSTPSFAQYQHCIAGRGCVPATQESYNACFQLALQRGLNVSMGDRYNLNSFIYQCLAGRIPR